MESKIIGTVMPVLEMSMQPGEKVFAEAGQLAWMSMALQMKTSTSAGGQQGGRVGDATSPGCTGGRPSLISPCTPPASRLCGPSRGGSTETPASVGSRLHYDVATRSRM